MLQFRHAVIAAGAEPVRLGIDGEQHLATSQQFLEFDSRPPLTPIASVGLSEAAARARTGI